MTTALFLSLILGFSAPSPPEEASPTPKPETQVLDPAHRRLRGNQLGIDAFGGSMSGRAIGQSFIAGGRLTYYPIRHLGIGAMYGYSRGSGGLDTVDASSVHFLEGQLELPLISALRLGRRHIVQMDLFGEAGGGAVHIARAWEPMGVVGGGVRIYPRIRWLAIRVDALTFLHNTRRASGKAFDTDVAFTVGLTVLLPRAR